MLIAPLCCQHLRVRRRARLRRPPPSGPPPTPPPAAWSPPLWRFYQDWRHPPCSVEKLHFTNPTDPTGSQGEGNLYLGDFMLKMAQK